MIANSVGLAVVDSSRKKPSERLKKISYYWGNGDEGIPREIFGFLPPGISPLSHNISASDRKKTDLPKFWPLSGVSVVDTSVSVDEKGLSGESLLTDACRLLVLGHIVVKQTQQLQSLSINSGTSPEVSALLGSQSLDFKIVRSAVAVVSNPYSPPDLWTYDWKLIPEIQRQGSQDHVSYEWFGLTPSSGRFATTSLIENSYLYLLGVYVSSKQSSRKAETSHDIFSVATVRHNIIGRVPVSSVLNGTFNIEVLSEYQGATSPGDSAKWIGVSGKESTLVPPLRCFPFEGVATEGTLDFDEGLSQWIFVALIMMENSIKICRLDATRGRGYRGVAPGIDSCNWHCNSISAVDQRWTDSAHIVSYAGRLHYELMSTPSSTDRRAGSAQLLARRRDIVISYVPNTVGGPNDLFLEGNNRAYTPKFVSIKLELEPTTTVSKIGAR